MSDPEHSEALPTFDSVTAETLTEADAHERPDPDELARASELADAIRAQVSRVVLGQTALVDQLLWTLVAGGHALLEGVPGLGKTLAVLALARTFGGKFARVQFTPDLMPSDVTGHVVFDRESGAFRLRRGPAFTNLLLADEINRSPAKTQAALLEVMQEGQITIEGETHRLEPPFFALATQNPIELEGTYPLPEAQLDRFLMKIEIGYPAADDETRIVEFATRGRAGEGLAVGELEVVATPEDVLAMQRVAGSLVVSRRVADYAVRLVRATRDHAGLAFGAGPRGAIALVRVARAVALTDGRDFVTPDDVREIAAPVLRHRVTLAPELELEGMRTDAILEGLFQAVEPPRA
ncbi:MAG: MoxR family ATPase [Planctomycetota bacterium]